MMMMMMIIIIIIINIIIYRLLLKCLWSVVVLYSTHMFNMSLLLLRKKNYCWYSKTSNINSPVLAWSCTTYVYTNSVAEACNSLMLLTTDWTLYPDRLSSPTCVPNTRNINSSIRCASANQLSASDGNARQAMQQPAMQPTCTHRKLHLKFAR